MDLPKDPPLQFPPYITLAHSFNAPTKWGIETRTLNQYQFQYVVEGAANYSVTGNTYYTSQGDLIYHAPNEPHSIEMIEDEPYVCLSILFHFGDQSFEHAAIFGDSHHLGCFLNHSIGHKLSQLVAYYHQQGLTTMMYCQGLLLQVLHEIAQWRNEHNTQKTTAKHKARLVLVRNYLQDHYQENVRHEQLQEISGLSRNYLIVKFKQLFGVTPFEYLSRIRIEKAKQLAVHTDLTISEIAEQIGFADVHTFGKMFKKKTGISLSQYCASIVTTP